MVLNIKKRASVYCIVLITVIAFCGNYSFGKDTQSGINDTIKSGEVDGKTLLINSYHKGLSWTDDITSAIEEKLSGEVKTELYVEYLDAKRSSVDMYDRELYNLFRKRYSRINFNAVIVSDNNALAFVKKYREKLFPDTPVIFCGINNFSDNLIDASGWYSGVVEKTDVLSTFKIIKKINPELRRCIIIGDDTPTGKAEISAAETILGSERDGVRIIYWLNLSEKTLLERLKELNPRDDAVLLTVFNNDADRHYYNYEESCRLITGNTSAPVYGLWDFYLGQGVVGGCMTNARDQGAAAALMAVRIIKGEDHSGIMIQRESPNRVLFDYAALNRFGIAEDHLPEGSVIRNIPSNIFRDNIGIIAGVLILIFIEGAALFLLFWIYLKSRKRAIKDIEESEKKYRVLVDNSFDIIYRINNDGVITYASPSWRVVLGHDVSDVVGKPYTDFIHPDDVEECVEFLKKVLISAERQSGVDYRVRHNDGSWRTHTSSAVPVLDESGNFAAFVGIAKDITERKIFEIEIQKLLKEKELLLQEVHHRIKNNMLTISSLLYLQANSVQNDVVTASLNDARNRVQGMMVIYDKLYRSADFRSISAKDYLTDLVNDVASTYYRAKNIKIEMDIEDIILDSAVLFPAGIIINELMSNSYKYAFPDNRDGVIKICLIRKSEKSLEIIFKDNGSGIPDESISGKLSGFGMSLVKILVAQINGDLELRNNNGAEYIISFPS